MKVGLVLEGGAMRGLYTAGVIDTFLKEKIDVDTIIGVSAGALFGMNYKSKQIGRVLRYNKAYVGNKDYMGVYSFLKTMPNIELFKIQFYYIMDGISFKRKMRKQLHDIIFNTADNIFDEKIVDEIRQIHIEINDLLEKDDVEINEEQKEILQDQVLK